MQCNRVAKTTKTRCKNTVRPNSSWCGKCRGIASVQTGFDNVKANLLPDVVEIDALEDLTPDYLLGLEDEDHVPTWSLFGNISDENEMYDAVIHFVDVYDEAIAKSPFNKKQAMVERALMDSNDILTGPVTQMLHDKYPNHISFDRSMVEVTIAGEEDYFEHVVGEVDGERVEFKTLNTGQFDDNPSIESIVRNSLAGQIKLVNYKGSAFYAPEEGVLLDVVKALNQSNI